MTGLFVIPVQGNMHHARAIVLNNNKYRAAAHGAIFVITLRPGGFIN